MKEKTIKTVCSDALCELLNHVVNAMMLRFSTSSFTKEYTGPLIPIYQMSAMVAAVLLICPFD